jgi:hypothetical protein
MTTHNYDLQIVIPEIDDSDILNLVISQNIFGDEAHRFHHCLIFS